MKLKFLLIILVISTANYAQSMVSKRIICNLGDNESYTLIHDHRGYSLIHRIDELKFRYTVYHELIGPHGNQRELFYFYPGKNLAFEFFPDPTLDFLPAKLIENPVERKFLRESERGILIDLECQLYHF